eukprot:6044971-Pyramimonas_sp.AAC.1
MKIAPRPLEWNTSRVAPLPRRPRRGFAGSRARMTESRAAHFRRLAQRTALPAEDRVGPVHAGIQ